MFFVISDAGRWYCRRADAIRLWQWSEYHDGEVCRIEPADAEGGGSMETKLDPVWIMEKLHELLDELELGGGADWHVSIRVRFRPLDGDLDRITFSVGTEPGE